MLKRQQLENDEEEFQKSPKKQALSTSVISTSIKSSSPVSLKIQTSRFFSPVKSTSTKVVDIVKKNVDEHKLDVIRPDESKLDKPMFDAIKSDEFKLDEPKFDAIRPNASKLVKPKFDENKSDEPKPERMRVSEKKKLFENAIKEETENARRVKEQELYLLSKKRFGNPSSNQLKTTSYTYLPKKLNTSIYEKKFGNSTRSEADKNKEKEEEENDNNKLNSSLAINETNQPMETSTPESKKNHKHQDDEEKTEKTESNVSIIKSNVSIIESNVPTIQSVDIIIDSNDPIEPNNPAVESNIPVIDTSDPTIESNDPSIELNHPTVKSDDSIMESNNPKIESNVPVITSVIKKPTSCQQQEVSRPTTPVIRTLSQYRREQKQRAAMYSTPIKKLKLNEDENENKNQQDIKWQTYCEDLREKLIKYKKLVEQYQETLKQEKKAKEFCLNSVEHRGSYLQIETEKLLLLTTLKCDAVQQEIELISAKLKGTKHKIPDKPIVNGSISIKKIEIPLKGDFVVSQVSDNDPLSHYFICVIKYGEQIMETELLSSTDSIQDASITFLKNKFNFNNLDTDFEIEISVYGLALMNVKKHDKKTSIMNSVKLPPISPRLSRSKKHANTHAFSALGLTNEFSLLGTVKLNIDNVLDRKYELEDYLYNAPLIGQLECDLSLSANYNIELKDHLDFFEEVVDKSGEVYSTWRQRWCVLKGYHLAYWRFPGNFFCSNKIECFY